MTLDVPFEQTDAGGADTATARDARPAQPELSLEPQQTQATSRA